MNLYVTSITEKKKEVCEPLSHALSGLIAFLAKSHPDAFVPAIRLLLGQYDAPGMMKWECVECVSDRARPFLTGLLGDCLEWMGLEPFLKHVFITVSVESVRDG